MPPPFRRDKGKEKSIKQDNPAHEDLPYQQKKKQNVLKIDPENENPMKLDKSITKSAIESVFAKSCTKITKIDFLIPLAESLRNLNLSRTNVQDWKGLEKLENLHVLDISHCNLKEIPKPVSKLTQLRALIISHNDIEEIPEYIITNKPNLDSLVISHNKNLNKLPMSLSKHLPNLAKLSASYANLDGSTLPDLTLCSKLQQVRLNHNTRLTSLPEHFAIWARKPDRKGGNLRLVALSGCSISEWEDILPLANHEFLQNLSITGNPLVESDEDGYKEKLTQLFPKLRVIDEQRINDRPQLTMMEKLNKRNPLSKSNKDEAKESKDIENGHEISDKKRKRAETGDLKEGKDKEIKKSKSDKSDNNEDTSSDKMTNKEKKKEKKEKNTSRIDKEEESESTSKSKPKSKSKESNSTRDGKPTSVLKIVNVTDTRKQKKSTNTSELNALLSGKSTSEQPLGW